MEERELNILNQQEVNMDNARAAEELGLHFLIITQRHKQVRKEVSHKNSGIDEHHLLGLHELVLNYSLDDLELEEFLVRPHAVDQLAHEQMVHPRWVLLSKHEVVPFEREQHRSKVDVGVDDVVVRLLLVDLLLFLFELRLLFLIKKANHFLVSGSEAEHVSKQVELMGHHFLTGELRCQLADQGLKAAALLSLKVFLDVVVVRQHLHDVRHGLAELRLLEHLRVLNHHARCLYLLAPESFDDQILAVEVRLQESHAGVILFTLLHQRNIFPLLRVLHLELEYGAHVLGVFHEELNDLRTEEELGRFEIADFLKTTLVEVEQLVERKLNHVQALINY